MAITSEDGDSNHGEDATLANSDGRDLLLRAKQLQVELEQFGKHLADVYTGYFQEFPKRMHVSFYNCLRTEIENLENNLDSPDPLASHRISSTNFPYLQACWDTAKRSKEIVLLRHPVFSGPFRHRILAPGIRIRTIFSQGGSEPKRNQGGRSARIDVISDGGRSWYKVSSITNKRLLFDMAKEAVYFSDGDDDESRNGSSQDFSDVPLVKLAKRLKTIAQGHQIRNTNPQLNLVLPRIFEGQHAEIDRLLEFCRDIGVNVSSGSTLPPVPPLSYDLLHEMVPSPRASITQVLNIDTSVLVALTSDISHFQVQKEPWFGQSQKDHIDLESKEAITTRLFPLLGHHVLVCTREAAESLARIVHTMGTDSENARAHLFLSSDDSMSHEHRIENLRALSIYKDSISSSLQLPIRIVDSNEDDCQLRLVDPIREKLQALLQPGRSVFSYGWAKGLTTVTCNALAVKQLEKSLEELPSLGTLEWPSIWAFSSSRPLVGVRKGSSQRRMRKHVGDCRVTCTCGLKELYDS
ncbi:hypothetical protein F5Y19DRAFT_469103 [Xylariaceae sp. FL1651]|nr:hypothetical protein F5Y19DRAFT_469103 [Xylariaceae sp. FL1651]